MKFEFESQAERQIVTQRLGVAANLDDDALSDCLMAAFRLEPRRAALSGEQRAEAEAVIKEAIADNKFRTERKDHYLRRWARDPDGTRKLIGRLAPSYGGADDDQYPAEWMRGQERRDQRPPNPDRRRVTTEDL